MARQKHGDYDHKKGLPNNIGKPVGSGSIVRWHEQIVERLGIQGQHIIEESRERDEYGDRGPDWICAELLGLGHHDLVDAYQQSCRDDAAARRYRDKERRLKMLQERLATEELPEAARKYLEREAVKAKKYLETRKPKEEKHET